jgi:RHS repeat-associated protein
MTGISSPAGVFGYAYATPNPASALVSGISLPNGTFITNTYDTVARLTDTASANQFGHVLDGCVYGLDLLGLRTNMTRNLGLTTNTVAIGYDGIDQLTSWSGKETNGVLRHNEQLAYAYDAAGNLNIRTNDALVQTFNVDALNQISNVTRIGPLTVTGATPVPATNVTVNGVTAQTYGDFTFAGGSNTLAAGANTFTNIAQNIYGTSATTVLSVNLPATVTFQYDAKGNLINDGTRVFSYDAENQLTNVMVSNQFQITYVYDGFNRRRITREYTWQTTNWFETNEIRYIYDGNLVLQERDTNNNPQVTYTRGLDLSLSRQEGGGIGGLLARTDSNGPAYYYADGSGNITALMDAYQNIVARYHYDAYGKLLGKWGSMADANHYWYSSKEQDPNGLYYYGFRFYEPNFQRWLNPDPIGEAGGINLYSFVGNSPINRTDFLGLSPQDVQNIVNQSHQYINDLTQSGQRVDNGFLFLWPNNNIMADMNGLVTGHILECGQQADVVAARLTAGKYDAHWTFTVENLFPIPHQYGMAKSNDPNDPTILFDPYFNSVSVNHPLAPPASVNALINVNTPSIFR